MHRNCPRALLSGVLFVWLPCAVYGQDSDRSCGAAPFPKKLPAADAVIDSAHFHAQLTAFAVDVRPAEVLLAVHFRSDGYPYRTLVIESELGADTAAAYRIVFEQALRPQDAGDPWGVRLRVFTGDVAAGTAPEFRVERCEYCSPDPIDRQPRGAIGREVAVAYTDEELRDMLAARGEMKTRVLVGVDGRVKRVELLRGSGSRWWDRRVEEELWEVSYRPALLDGLSFETWHERTQRIRRR